MSYVIYNIESTVLVTRDTYKTVAAAKAFITREERKGKLIRGDVAIADAAEFHANIEKSVERVNMMSGKTYRESVNTPNYCSPSSEAYWSM
jgi:hypothetical protein